MRNRNLAIVCTVAGVVVLVLVAFITVAFVAFRHFSSLLKEAVFSLRTRLISFVYWRCS